VRDVDQAVEPEFFDLALQQCAYPGLGDAQKFGCPGLGQTARTQLLGDAHQKFRAQSQVLYTHRIVFKGFNLGDCKSAGGGVMEMRIRLGPDYRVYFACKGDLVYVLLCAGTKSRQQRDIMRARMLLRQLKLD